MAPASANPKGPSFPLLCAQGKHSAGRRSQERGREAVGLQATAVGRAVVPGPCPPAQGWVCCRHRAGFNKGSTVQRSDQLPCREHKSAKERRVPRATSPQRPQECPTGLLFRFGGRRTGLGHRLPLVPGGASDLEDPIRKWGGEATPGHPSASPGIPSGSPRQGEAAGGWKTPGPTSSPTLPQRPPGSPAACPLHLPVNSISLSSLKTTEL